MYYQKKIVLFMRTKKLKKFIEERQEMHQKVHGKKNSYHQKFQ